MGHFRVPIKGFNQNLAAFIGALSSTLNGLLIAWLSPVTGLLTSDQGPFHLTPGQLVLLNTLPLASSIVTACFSVPTADRWGRRTALLLVMPLGVLSFSMIAFWPTLLVFSLARTMHGVLIGFSYPLAPVYAAEVLDTDSRGRTGFYVTFTYQLGVMYSYAIGPLTTLRVYAALSTIPFVVSFLTLCLMPESPVYLARRGRLAEAEAALIWLRGGGPVEEELREVEEAAVCGSGRWSDLFAKPRPLVVLCVLAAVKYFSGFTTVVTYLHTTLSKFDSGNVYWISIGLEGACAVSSLLAFSVLDLWGRRPVVLTSLALMALSSGCVAIFSYLKEVKGVLGDSSDWMQYVALCAMLSVGHMGLGPVVDLVQAEYFPFHVRRKGVIVVGTITFISTGAVFIVYPYLLRIGTYVGFTLFFSSCIFGLVMLIPFMKETARVPLSQIDP